jgi:hypothetical protein
MISLRLAMVVSLEPDRIFIDIRTCELRMSQLMEEIRRIQEENPDYEVFLDGDAYAIVGRKRDARCPAEG